MTISLMLNKFLPLNKRWYKFLSQYGPNVSVTVIARNSCPGICDHQAQCGYPPLKTATDHKPLHFIYYYNLVLLKNVMNQKKNEQRNYCFQSFPASLATLFVIWLKTRKETNRNGSQFQCSFWKFCILIYNKSHVITKSNRNGVPTGIFKCVPKTNSLTTENHLNPNYWCSPAFYDPTMEAHFNMLIDSDFSKQPHDY